MRKIAVMEDFLTPERRKKVLDTAEKCGFAVDFYGRGAAPAQGLEQYEIIYGWCNPQDLKRATGLKWYCCGFAGVDQLSDDSLYASPDVVLSNSSGAYGLTISEHILMVTLMLLRRMPEFQDIVRRREWVSELPMRSIYGSRITVLGAGDIGTNFARRAKALGAGHICGVSRSGRNPDPAYDRMLPQEQLDQVLPETEILVMALPSVADTVGILSRERIALLPENARPYQDRIDLAIDHHPSQEFFARETCLEAGSAACGEIVYNIVTLMTPLTPEIALPLYVAVSTDTGCFVYSNTTARTHRIAAALMDCGIDVAPVNKALFRTKSRTRLAMEAWMAEWAEYYDHDRVVVMQIPLSLCLDYKATEADVEELSSLAALVEGTDCGVTLRELKDGRVKISLRTGPRVNATEVCALLGGGGHAAAAGATLHGTLGEVKQAVLQAIDMVAGED